MPIFGKIKDLVTWVAAFWKDQNNSVVHHPILGDVVLDKHSASSSVGHGLRQEKAQAFALVPDVVKTGILLGKMPPITNKPAAYLIGAPVKIGDEDYKLYVEVRQLQEMKRMYIHEVVLRKNAPVGAFKIAAASQEGAEPRTAHHGAIFSFLQSLHDVKSSKVVDENGDPLVVYHGAINDVAKVEHSAKKRTRGGRDGAFFFSPDADIASAYAGTAEGRQQNEVSGNYDKVHYGMEDGGNVMSVFLSLKHPLVFDANGRVYDQIEDAAFDIAKSGKHDGIVFRNIVDQPGAQGSLRAYESDAYVAFQSSQVKSAIGNNGAFSLGDDALTKFLPLAVHIMRR